MGKKETDMRPNEMTLRIQSEEQRYNTVQRLKDFEERLISDRDSVEHYESTSDMFRNLNYEDAHVGLSHQNKKKKKVTLVAKQLIPSSSQEPSDKF